jgi:hypothetical protein
MPMEKKACIVDIKKKFGINTPKEVNGTATKCRVYTVHEWLKNTVFVPLESK